jgi:hypothetical protein
MTKHKQRERRDAKEMPMAALLLLTVFSILKKVSAANPCEGSYFYRSGFSFFTGLVPVPLL